MTKAILAMVACVVPLWVCMAQAGLTPEQKCLVDRAKAAAKYHTCVLKILGKCDYGAGCFVVDKNAKLAKCRIKYYGAFTSLQALTGTPCDHKNRWDDNGDGTVTDHLTGLVWEQKTTVVGSGQNLADPHDVDNRYSWTETSSESDATDEDGTAYTDFLAGLNTSGFASANGWRLPTLVELTTTLLPEAYPCTTAPCIDAIFGPTQSDPYYSSTSFDDNTVFYLYPSDGYVSYNYKSAFGGAYVRAVRGGL